MDYIREELLRQQALLVVLLTGRRPEPLEEERTGDTGRETDRESAGAASPRRAASAERDYGPQTTDLWEILRGGQTAAPDLETAGERLAVRSRGGETPAGPRSRQNVRTEGDRRETVSAGTASESGGEVRLVAELHPAQARAGTGAAELSRAFQRDARRYDGGFRLY